MSKHDDETVKRVERYENLRVTMREAGYREKQCTISIVKANIMALLTTAPIVLACLVLFLIKWNRIDFNIDLLTPLWFVLIFFACIIIHELLHGLTWSVFCKNKWKSIHIGVMWKMLTPYCHCKETLTFGGYILGGLMPLLVLGIGLFALSMVTGHVFMLFISIINIISAGGDVTIALMLWKHRKALIYDHPTECGFVAFYPPM